VSFCPRRFLAATDRVVNFFGFLTVAFLGSSVDSVSAELHLIVVVAAVGFVGFVKFVVVPKDFNRDNLHG